MRLMTFLPASVDRYPRLKLALCLTTMLCSGFAVPALAQSTPPIRQSVDPNGVDLFLGTVNLSTTDVSIGSNDMQGLSFRRFWQGTALRDNVNAQMTLSGNVMTVALGEISDSFTVSGTTYSPTEGNGAALTFNSSTNIFTYTARDGSVVFFSKNNSNSALYTGEQGRATEITRPSGERLTMTYQSARLCTNLVGDACRAQATIYRVASARNASGYILTFTYGISGTGMRFDTAGDAAEWMTVYSVKAVNQAVEYCDPAAAPCSTTGNWPTASSVRGYSGGDYVISVTDPLNRTTKFTSGGSGIKAVRRPGSASDDISVTYNATTGRVASVITAVGTSNYAFSDTSGVRTTTMTNPAGQVTTYTFDIASQRMTSMTDPLGRVTFRQYDATGRPKRATAPEGNYTEITYDARGNATQTLSVAKAGSGLANLTTSASFPATCTNARTCNQPTSTTDAKGNITDYTYDASHGGVLTITAPAAMAGGIRPQTRYSYISYPAQVKNSAGSIISGGTNVVKLTGVSNCQTTTSCAGAADEIKTTIAYGSTGVGNNLLPTSSTTASGDGAVSATTVYGYDAVGNLTTVDGPLSGAADISAYRYDAGRQQVGAVGPDPDGAGARKHQAVRMAYDGKGRRTLVEVGNVNSQSDADWASFVSQQSASTVYDAADRPTEQRLVAGGTTYSVSQYSYDTAGRLDCSTLRMNSAAWTSLPVSACTLQAANSDGENDRVTKNIYNAAGEVTQVQVAVGTADVSNEVSTTYTPNGKTATVKDGENNLTTYEYDGFDRLAKTRYPVVTLGSDSSSSTDYEQLSYDANGNVTQRRLRDGQLINYSFDNLDRVTLKDLPGAEPDVSMTYDLPGKLTGASQSGNNMNFQYDALGRNTQASGPLGATTYSYDSGGRRTSMTYPTTGGATALTVNYDYDVTGNVMAIRENGAPSGVGVLATYGYDDLGRRINLTRGNGTVTSFAFDPVSRLSALAHDVGGTVNDLTIGSFTYNPASQIVGQSRSNDAYAWNGHYNISRSYGANGLNQLTSAGATTLGYDGRGNLTASGSNVYGYSSENLLNVGPAGAALGYDPAMRLYQSVGGGATTRFGYDGADLIAEYNAANNLTRRYVHGPDDDEPIVWYEGAGLADRRFLHSDERGSVIAVTDGSGAVTNINLYDEYGIPAASNIGRFQYTGQAWLPELGMYYFKARIYSPTLGRFMQSDPIGYSDGINWYNYVGSDPVNGTDPSGLLCQSVTGSHLCYKDGGQSGGGGWNGGTIIVSGFRIIRPSPPSVPLATVLAFAQSTAGEVGTVVTGRGKKKLRPQNKRSDQKKCISPSDGPVDFTGGGLDLVLGTGGGIGFYKFFIPSTGASGWVASGGFLGGAGAFFGGSKGRIDNFGNFTGYGWRGDFATPIPAVGGEAILGDKGNLAGGAASVGAGGGFYGGRTKTRVLSSNIPICP